MGWGDSAVGSGLCAAVVPVDRPAAVNHRFAGFVLEVAEVDQRAHQHQQKQAVVLDQNV